MFNFPFEVEHILPKALGGETVESNLALACRACNVLKGSSVCWIDPESGAEVRLFHPRQDEWDEHFQADAESGNLQGITPVGRATMARLQMNRSSQRLARVQWMRLGLFP